jgi:hypothetical protein
MIFHNQDDLAQYLTNLSHTKLDKTVKDWWNRVGVTEKGFICGALGKVSTRHADIAYHKYVKQMASVLRNDDAQCREFFDACHRSHMTVRF